MKIVRVKESSYSDFENKWIHKVRLLKYDDWIYESTYMAYGREIKLFPYKWYDPRRFLKAPTYYFVLYRKRFSKSIQDKRPLWIEKSENIWKVFVFLVATAISIYIAFKKK